MTVTFRRTGAKRYSIAARRTNFPDVVMDPAPGYDDLLPHDVLHLTVEAALGLSRGVFGQLAAGGDASSFSLPHDPSISDREMSRVRRDIKRRGERLAAEGREDSAQSERATFVGWYEWLSRSDSPERRRRSESMRQQASIIRESMTGPELAAFDQALGRICEHLDEISARWSVLKVGESVTIEWPTVALLSES